MVNHWQKLLENGIPLEETHVTCNFRKIAKVVVECTVYTVECMYTVLKETLFISGGPAGQNQP